MLELLVVGFLDTQKCVAEVGSDCEDQEEAQDSLIHFRRGGSDGG